MNRTNKNSDDGSEITTAGNTSGGNSRVAHPLPQELKHDRVVLSGRESEVMRLVLLQVLPKALMAVLDSKSLPLNSLLKRTSNRYIQPSVLKYIIQYFSPD